MPALETPAFWLWDKLWNSTQNIHMPCGEMPAFDIFAFSLADSCLPGMHTLHIFCLAWCFWGKAAAFCPVVRPKYPQTHSLWIKSAVDGERLPKRGFGVFGEELSTGFSTRFGFWERDKTDMYRDESCVFLCVSKGRWESALTDFVEKSQRLFFASADFALFLRDMIFDRGLWGWYCGKRNLGSLREGAVTARRLRENAVAARTNTCMRGQVKRGELAGCGSCHAAMEMTVIVAGFS
ncbi:MAG: hypothetical protein ACI4WX_06155 [Aristaeellaceae bacterium]